MAKIIIEIDDEQLIKLDRLVNFLEKYFEANITEESQASVKPLKKETKQERIERVGIEFEKKQATRAKKPTRKEIREDFLRRIK